MRSSTLRIKILTGGVTAALTCAVLSATAPAASAATTQKHCTIANTNSLPTAKPSEEAMDQSAVNAAILYAQTHLRASVQIFRNDCKIGQGLLDPITDQVPMELFSSTKSVISILTGVAYDQHKLKLDDPIGKYLPKGWGDAAHRAITIRNLLTETSGLDEAILSEFVTVGLDPNIAQEALAQPLTHKPGTHFEYSQRTPDLLAYVVQRAVGQDLQAYAQKYVFGPIGIPKSSYLWLRDRAQNTYGYANLFMPPVYFAKLGLLMEHGGTWGGKRLLSTDYISKLRTPTKTNGCYGYLFWVNGGKTCTSANIPHAQTLNGQLIGSAPKDLYAMVGALQQNNFIIPSLHMTVTWTGVLGDTPLNLAGILSASGTGSDLYYNFFRLLMRGVKDQHIADPGPFKTPPLDLDVNPINYLSPAVLLRDLLPNANCNILLCPSPPD
jgi:CubicO group peptidase (beta-lactamase class C family)